MTRRKLAENGGILTVLVSFVIVVFSADPILSVVSALILAFGTASMYGKSAIPSTVVLLLCPIEFLALVAGDGVQNSAYNPFIYIAVALLVTGGLVARRGSKPPPATIPISEDS